MNSLDWLLDSEPAIRWQALRDLTDSAPEIIAAERNQVAKRGCGAAILAAQQQDGSWRRPDAPVWLPTLFTLLMLKATGIDPADPDVESAIKRLEANLRWSDQPYWELRGDDGNSFFDGEEEPCINGGVLAAGAYFGRPSEKLARRLLSEQLEDGGWNCEAPMSKRSSFHTTICVLEGLLEYEKATGGHAQIAEARKRGEEYLLKRRLFRRLSTGKPVDPAFEEFAFPPRYHYDVLRALDYLRLAKTAALDELTEGLDLIERKRGADGRWNLDRAYDEALAVPLGEKVGEPSWWNTLRTERVLRWFGRAA